MQTELNKMSNSFDDKIKESLENFEMPYDAAAWTQIEKQLPSTPPAAAPNPSNTGKIAAVVGIVAIAGAAFWFTQTDETPEQVTETLNPTPVIEQVEPEQAGSASSTINQPKTSVSEKAVEKTDSEELEPINENPVAESEIAEATPNKSATEITEEKTKDKAEVAQDPEPTKSVKEPTTEELFIIDFTVESFKVCVGEDVRFTNQSSDKSAAIVWDFGDGASSSESNPTHQFFVPGIYTVILKSEKNASVSKSMSIKVDATPTPVMSVDRKLEGYTAIPLYTFTTVTQPNETAIWRFSDETSFEGNNTTHLFRNGGEQVAKLTITNSAGCSFTVDRKMETEKFNLLAPEAFTPNGDGINETFIPEALPEMGVAFEMIIKNPRTGQLVYRTENPLAPWNGKTNNSGQTLETGVYIWTVVLKENIVGNKVFNGKISLQP